MKHKKSIVFIILIILLVVSFFFGLIFGSTNIPIDKFFEALFSNNTYSIIIKKLRLPRVLGAILSGIALSTSGVLLQRITANDLASPSIVGINAGAGLGVMLILCFLPKLTYLLAEFAFIGAFLSVLLVILVSSNIHSHNSSATLVLTGIAIASLFNAVIAFLSQMYPDVLSSYVVFSSGGFSSVHLQDLLIPSILIIAGFIITLFLGKYLNLLSLGDDMATNLGVNVKRLKIIALLLISLMTSASVSYAGLLGFVGLMVPHIASRIVGNNNVVLLPASALIGAIMVTISDLIGRAAFAPSEISAGIILSFVGAPFFVYLLFRRKNVYGN